MSEESRSASISASAGFDLAAILQDYVPRGEYESALEALNQAVEERNVARLDREKDIERLQDLQKKVRGRSWRDAFDKVRRDEKRRDLRVKDEFADDVFRLLDLQQDSDEPDESGISRALESFLKEKKGYLDAAEARKELPRGEGSARGKSVSPGEPEFRVKRSELSSAAYMRENQGKVAAATRAGLLVIDDD